MEKKKLQSRVRIYIASALGILVILLVSIFWGHIINQLNGWKVLPQHEKVTELYFNDSTNLPDVYSPGINQTVNFTIHNIEGKTTTYKYALSELKSDGTQSQLLTSSSISLADNQAKTIALTVSPVDKGSRAQFVIKLVGQNQSINYWAYEVPNDQN